MLIYDKNFQDEIEEIIDSKVSRCIDTYNKGYSAGLVWNHSWVPHGPVLTSNKCDGNCIKRHQDIYDCTQWNELCQMNEILCKVWQTGWREGYKQKTNLYGTLIKKF